MGLFKKKCEVSILDSDWKVLKNNIKISILPRINEYIFMDDKYHQVLNVVHRFGEHNKIYVIVLETDKKNN